MALSLASRLDQQNVHDTFSLSAGEKCNAKMPVPQRPAFTYFHQVFGELKVSELQLVQAVHHFSAVINTAVIN